MPLGARRGAAYGSEYYPGDHAGGLSQREQVQRALDADAIEEYRLGLADEVVRMRPNPRRDNGLVFRMQGGERVGNPELLPLVELRALYKTLLEQGYAKM